MCQSTTHIEFLMQNGQLKGILYYTKNSMKNSYLWPIFHKRMDDPFSMCGYIQGPFRGYQLLLKKKQTINSE